jgi:hypothetical protein
MESIKQRYRIITSKSIKIIRITNKDTEHIFEITVAYTASIISGIIASS